MSDDRPREESLRQARDAADRHARARAETLALAAERDEAMRRAVDDGHSLREVAAATGLSWAGVRDRISRLDP